MDTTVLPKCQLPHDSLVRLHTVFPSPLRNVNVCRETLTVEHYSILVFVVVVVVLKLIVIYTVHVSAARSDFPIVLLLSRPRACMRACLCVCVRACVCVCVCA